MAISCFRHRRMILLNEVRRRRRKPQECSELDAARASAAPEPPGRQPDGSMHLTRLPKCDARTRSVVRSADQPPDRGHVSRICFSSRSRRFVSSSRVFSTRWASLRRAAASFLICAAFSRYCRAYACPTTSSVLCCPTLRGRPYVAETRIVQKLSLSTTV